MRRFLLAAMMFGTVSGAQAADMPDFLRGTLAGRSATDGQLAGLLCRRPGRLRIVRREFQRLDREHDRGAARGHVIESSMGVSQWNLGLGKDSARATGYGAFAGYNAQWDDVVLGLEASYLHGNFGGSAIGV